MSEIPPFRKADETGGKHLDDHNAVVDVLQDHAAALRLVHQLLADHEEDIEGHIDDFGRHEHFLNVHGWLIVLLTLVTLLHVLFF